MDCAVGPNRIAQARAILQRLAVDDDAHVSSQRRLIVENITAQPLIETKDVVEHLAHRRARAFCFGAVDVSS